MFVEVEFRRWVHLEDRGGVAGRDRAFHGSCHRFGFAFSEGQEKDRSCLHDCPDAHRDHVVGDVVLGCEEVGVVGPGALGECLDSGARGERRGRLVEPDMPVAAEAENGSRLVSDARGEKPRGFAGGGGGIM